jgi:D-3-phosphoglycerate dehydrogenase
MGKNDVNIANFTLGRAAEGGQAIALLYVDAPVSNLVLADLQATGKFNQVSRLEFDVS